MKVTYQGTKFVAICSYDEREIPKSAGFRWDAVNKQWWTDDVDKAAKVSEYCDELAREAIEPALAKKAEAIKASKASFSNTEFPVPDGLDYFPFQKAGIEYALPRTNVLIGDEMGLGKTIQAIGIINTKEEIKKVLIICAASLKLNWRIELKRWLTRDMSIGICNGNFPNTDIVIINYDLLKKYRQELRSCTWDLLISDECHYLKNPKAQRTIETLGGIYRGQNREVILPIDATQRVFMTGSPIVNRPIEMWPILHSTGKPWTSWFFFVTRYCNGIQTRYGWDVSGASHLDEFQDKLRETVMIRRLKKDVLKDLPPKRRQIIVLPSDSLNDVIAHEQKTIAKHQDAINQLKELIAKTSEGTEEYKKAVEQLTREQHVAFGEISTMRHDTALAKAPYVADFVLDALDSSDKIVMFAHHHDVVDTINKKLTDAGITTVVVTGETKLKDRQANIEKFQNDPDIKVYIGSIQASGLGITLTAASHVIFAELDWVPGNLSQAEDRCHRIGQYDSVLVQHIVLDGSLDANLAQTVIEKQEVIDKALDKDTKEEKITDKVWGTKTEKKAPKKTWGTKIETKKEEPTTSVEEKKEIHQKLRILAGMCDGAFQRDGCGFNKLDTNFGKDLASRDELTDKQAIAAKKMLKKYKRQLGEK